MGIVARLPGDLHLIVARDIESQEALKRVLRQGLSLRLRLHLRHRDCRGRHREPQDVAAGGRGLEHGAGHHARQSRPAHSGHGPQRRVRPPGQNLNAMLDRIQDLMTGLKDVSDNIAHDLKTPLHRLRTRAERALQTSRSPENLAEALGSVIEEADALIQTFDCAPEHRAP